MSVFAFWRWPFEKDRLKKFKWTALAGLAFMAANYQALYIVCVESAQVSTRLVPKYKPAFVPAPVAPYVAWFFEPAHCVDKTIRPHYWATKSKPIYSYVVPTRPRNTPISRRVKPGHEAPGAWSETSQGVLIDDQKAYPMIRKSDENQTF